MQTIETTLGKIHTIEIDGERLYKTKDIAWCLNMEDYTTKFNRTVKRVGAIHMIPINTRYGLQSCGFVKEKSLRTALVSVRKPEAIKLAEELGFNIELVQVQRKEENTVLFIIRCFLNRFKMTRQYRVGKYRIDLYIHDLNAVVECDEDDHRYYDTEKDQERTECINAELANPTWIRYNPDDDIAEVVNKIIQLI